MSDRLTKLLLKNEKWVIMGGSYEEVEALNDVKKTVIFALLTFTVFLRTFCLRCAAYRCSEKFVAPEN